MERTFYSVKPKSKMGRLRLGGGLSCVSLALDCKVLVLGVNDRFNKYSDKQICIDVLSPYLFAEG